MRLSRADIEIEDDDRNRLGGVAGRFDRPQPDAAQVDVSPSRIAMNAYSAFAAAPR